MQNMQDLTGSLPGTYPITGLCIVSDKSACPAGYSVIARCHDSNEEADLWKDSFLRKKITRFLCITRVFPLANGALNNVLADIAVINENDNMPAQFSRIEYTQNSGDKALKKKVLCVKMVSRTSANDAISEIIFLSKLKRPPTGYTLIGDINNLLLCTKISPVPQDGSTGQQTSLPYSMPPSYMSKPPTYSMDAQAQGQNLPYTANPSLAPYMPPSHRRPSPVMQPSWMSSQGQGHSASSAETSGLVRQGSIQTVNSPLYGIPFELGPNLEDYSHLKNMTIPDVKYKTLMEVMSDYNYDFNAEKSAAARMPPE
ncbi:multivesicular body subunit 12B-like [Lingula anatina]|uniref:Multivesicular body subunit 12B-like n=1 Tax=Lingula anatina TaxID=7574 RepID=A0A1S3IEF3_LINAN|nr:multivesicular body subunit 12B-like [Lingula anatina]|eukprot:XP_013395839.1 multivesicular body subunit 12B-like [Lingula anatina]